MDLHNPIVPPSATPCKGDSRTLLPFSPIVVAAPLQIFAYYIAVALERDVDQPRNLAKSVTVE